MSYPQAVSPTSPPPQASGTMLGQWGSWGKVQNVGTKNYPNRETAAAAQIERRRSERLIASFPVEASGYDADHHFFVEKTATLEISRDGGRVLLNRPVKVGKELHIRMRDPFTSPSASEHIMVFRIIWVGDPDAVGRRLVGAECLASTEFWHNTYERLRPESR